SGVSTVQRNTFFTVATKTFTPKKQIRDDTAGHVLGPSRPSPNLNARAIFETAGQSRHCARGGFRTMTVPWRTAFVHRTRHAMAVANWRRRQRQTFLMRRSTVLRGDRDNPVFPVRRGKPWLRAGTGIPA